MKRVFRAICYLFRETAKYDKQSFLLEFLEGILEIIPKIFSVFFPAFVLNILFDSKGWFNPVTFVVVICFLLMVAEFLTGVNKRSLSSRSSRVANRRQQFLNQKAFRIDFAMTEDKKVSDKYYLASDAIWDTSDTDYMVLKALIGDAIMLLLTLLVFTRVHPLVAVCVLLTTLADYYVNTVVNKKEIKCDREQTIVRKERQYVDDCMFDQRYLHENALNGAKSFLMEKRSVLTGKLIGLIKSNKKIDFIEGVVDAGLEAIRLTVTYLIALKQYFDGKLLISDFLLFVGAAREMTYALYRISNSLLYLSRAADYLESYRQYVEIPENDRSEGEMDTPDEVHSLEFRDVCFRYPNTSDDVIKHMSFRINSGEAVVFVGDNGAGKSTLIKLMLRLYKADSGEILLDGKSIYDYRYADYQKLFAPVFQDFQLYSMTIGENVFCKDNFDSGQFDRLMQRVGLDEKMKTLEKGSLTPYSRRFYDDGVVFSGGEEQRLAIARAFSKEEAAFMVSDEPTAALDPIAEYEINHMMMESRGNVFTIMVSHRLNNVKLADRIIVISNGSVAEDGTHDVLMNIKNGIYRGMFEMQSEYYRYT